MQLRSLDRNWLARVDAWWGQLLPLVGPFMASRGGPVLMVQVGMSGMPHMTWCCMHTAMCACSLWCLTSRMMVDHADVAQCSAGAPPAECMVRQMHAKSRQCRHAEPHMCPRSDLDAAMQ